MQYFLILRWKDIPASVIHTQMVCKVFCLALIGQNLRKIEGDTVDDPGRELNELQNADWVSHLPYQNNGDIWLALLFLLCFYLFLCILLEIKYYSVEKFSFIYTGDLCCT